jgi:hypothetical protein
MRNTTSGDQFRVIEEEHRMLSSTQYLKLRLLEDSNSNKRFDIHLGTPALGYPFESVNDQLQS